MTNPIKKFFEVLKAIITFPVSFIQVRKAMKDMERFERLYNNPEEQKKLLAKMGILEHDIPLTNPMFQQMMFGEASDEVDMSYLDDLVKKRDDENSVDNEDEEESED